MRAQPDGTGDVRARAVFGHRAAALVARAGVVLLTFLFTLTYLASGNEIVSAVDARIAATMAGAFIIIACGLLALAAQRSGALRRDLRRLEERIEELSDRNWELKEADERSRSFLEALGDVIVRRDGEDRITYANDAFCRLADAPGDTLIGKGFLLPLEEQGPVTTLPDGTRIHDQKIATADGARWIAWREVAIRDAASGRTEIQSLGRDVTDRTRAERALAEARDAAEAASRAKSRFLAMVSHEIRTPLNGILGMADLIMDTPLSPEQANYAKAVKTSGDTLLSLIEEILDFSRIEAGRLDLDESPFALGLMVEEAVELLSPRAQAKDLEIASYIDELIPERVSGDAARLRQVLLNLAGNAVKFTEKGGAAIIVEPGAGRDEIIFEVRDTGIGIAAEAQSRIFEDFEQADSGSTRRFGGTGLGLAISRRIVERMGGRITIESAPDQGSSFRFAVTLRGTANAVDAGHAAPELAGRSILIVAPSAIEAPLLARRLGRWGARTCLVPDVNVAHALLPERHWDAILIDHALGADAARTLAGEAADKAERRIVLITPAERHELAGLEAAGFTGYLVKPVRAASLAARFAAEDAFDDRSADPAGNEALPQAGHGPFKGLTVLVAEDNDINALLARALLARLGHHPTVTTNGAAAVEAWLTAEKAGTPYDLVFMDVHMPEVDGLEATRRIRATEASLGARHTPVIALTANAFGEDRDACIAAGMDGFLVKPLNRERLAEILAARGRSAPLAA